MRRMLPRGHGSVLELTLVKAAAQARDNIR
jgi:hypothetical protein